MKRFFKLYLHALRKSFTIKGRASRAEFYAFHVVGLVPVLICFLFAWPAVHAIILLGSELFSRFASFAQNDSLGHLNAAMLQNLIELLSGVSGPSASPQFHLFPLVCLLLSLLFYLLPEVPLMIRRLHDIGFSGWFYVINFIPYFGSIILFLLLFLKKGNEIENRYGSIPDERPGNIHIGTKNNEIFSERIN